MRPCRTLGALLALLPLAAPAGAAPLWVDGEPESLGGCNLVRAQVERWSPAQGPPAAFLAQRFLDNGGESTLVVLGLDPAGVWTAELGAPSDACDDCDQLALVHTSFAGKRKRHLVADATHLSELEPEARRARVKQALFRLAAGPWRVSELSQRYRLTLPRHDAEGRLERYTGWFAEVAAPDRPALRFGVRSESQMCWCFPSWRGYALRA